MIKDKFDLDYIINNHVIDMTDIKVIESLGSIHISPMDKGRYDLWIDTATDYSNDEFVCKEVGADYERMNSLDYNRLLLHAYKNVFIRGDFNELL